MNKKVIALVVTYNRLNDLKNCLSALHQQTYKDFDILVVNNGSTDETKDYLDNLNDGTLIIHQENLGGAGGFYAGMKYMYDNNYDWLWMMDDDGIAEKHQLENLLNYADQFKFMNALVLDKDNHDYLAFGGFFGKSVQEIKKEKYILGIIAPFNGTFIHKTIIEKVGFIKKEMFIWGDEQEYTLRVGTAGITIATITDAIHYHPHEKGEKVKLSFRGTPYTILLKPKKLSHYYYRNLGYLDRTYRCKHWYKGISSPIVYTRFFLGKGDFKEAYKYLKYYIRGRNNNYK